MHWYLIHTKPRQEKIALENLERQGYRSYLPLYRKEKLRQRVLIVSNEPLFPRYLFINLGDSETDQSWRPIRSTKGVSRMVTFGNEPAKVDDALIDLLKHQEENLQNHLEPLFKPGELVKITEGPFAGIEGIYQMADGEQRAMVLIELLSKQVSMRIEPASLRKAG